MLVLTRKKGQKIVIGDNIEIVILDNDFNNIKIGVNAPRNVSVYREEVYVEIKRANEMSKMTDLNSLQFLEQSVLKSTFIKKKSI
ncbi:carbon storage regulator CsrA [bacterium]|nr:carbon storage regulator CsrA [bacterium]